MFQYAFGRSVADRLHVQLKLDITGFRTYKLRRYGLWALNIREDIASDVEAGVLGRSLPAKMRRRLTRSREVRERGFAFDASALNASDGSRLVGYWQSEKYFEESTERIRLEFSIRSPLEGRNALLARQMEEGTSISIHVRRGDYVRTPHTASIHNVCNEQYYLRCIDRLAQSVDEPRFFVFSDEPQWVRDHLPIPFPTTVVDHNTAARSFEDLRLMSLCRHHIIANSSFSWWGAWLDSAPDKIVLMPKRWFADKDPEETMDIRPKGWVPL
jgi:hypothetical protein